METFNFKLTKESSGEIDHKVNETNFGDGYVQATSVGINNKTATWTVTAIGMASYTRPIMNFIDRHQGAKSFYWTPPEGEQGRYRTSKYKLQNMGGNTYRISATFTQSYGVDTKAPEGSNVLSVNGETPDEYGDVTITAQDIGADPAGTASSQITELKKDKNPFPQYPLKETIPDFTELKNDVDTLKQSVTDIDQEVTNLQTSLTETNEFVAEVNAELETVSGELHNVKDSVAVLDRVIVKSVNGITPDPATGNVQIETGTGGVEINDNSPSKTTVYSGFKTNQLITNLQTEVNNKAVIDDSKLSKTTAFSSQKTAEVVNDKFAQLSNEDNKDKGAALVSFNADLEYPANTVGDALKNSSSGLPLFSVEWWPSRDHVPAGYVLADGQELSSSTYPDVAAAIAQNKVPTVSNTVWLSNPTTRGCYVAISSDGMFRIPDYNGMQPDSLGALFLRGDNGKSENGYIQLDAFQDHLHPVKSSDSSAQRTSNTVGLYGGPIADAVSSTSTSDPNYWITTTKTTSPLIGYASLDPNARTSSETRPINVSGCWIIKLFGAVANAGSANAEQLATDLANLAGRVDSVESWRNQPRFTIIYPNGGTPENPANVTTDSRFIMDNPFPNKPVITLAEIRWNGVWGECGWFYSNGGYGVKATHMIETDKIIVQTGGIAIGWQLSNAIGSPFGTTTPAAVQNVPCRIKVWRY